MQNDLARKRGAPWAIAGWLIAATLSAAMIVASWLDPGDVKSDLALTSMMSLCAIASGYVGVVTVLLLCRWLRDGRAIAAAVAIAVLLSIMWPALIAAAQEAAATQARARDNQ